MFCGMSMMGLKRPQTAGLVALGDILIRTGVLIFMMSRQLLKVFVKLSDGSPAWAIRDRTKIYLWVRSNSSIVITPIQPIKITACALRLTDCEFKIATSDSAAAALVGGLTISESGTSVKP